ncbi:hypothetical protein DR999_PMT12820 [Platysternon megacephalum]|uniref:Uncharacterized protein n=1 Tax=Platysternon megacephalum TaxID=55544 RepID=A0A4D9E2U8_9SAUR|nr:hypothetical protein DR999_PMT12820 [Platysternon megacephalum]
MHRLFIATGLRVTFYTCKSCPWDSGGWLSCSAPPCVCACMRERERYFVLIRKKIQSKMFSSHLSAPTTSTLYQINFSLHPPLSCYLTLAVRWAAVWQEHDRDPAWGMHLFKKELVASVVLLKGAGDSVLSAGQAQWQQEAMWSGGLSPRPAPEPCVFSS